MTVRQMEFNTGEETATIPTVSDPSADTDFVTKGYGDVNYMQGGRAVADVAALKAVAAADRHDNDIRLVDSLNALFKFDASSSDTGDDSTVITPDAGTGRWLITTSSGSGGGSGSRNYLQDSGSDTAESNIGDWVTYADAAGTTPVDGTGGSASITFTRNTTTPLRQTADFKLTVDAANRQGNGSSVDFAVDRADRNKVLGIWFDVDATDANYADDDLQVFIYDVDTDTLITPTSPSGAYKIKAQKYRFRVAFAPADTSSVNYRLIVHVASTNATGYSVYFDNFEVGPGNQLQYGFDGIWKTYTDADVTISNTPTGWSLKRAIYRPFKDSDGNWFLWFSVRATQTSATTIEFDIDGITTKNVTNWYQPLYCGEQGTNLLRCWAYPNDNTMHITLATGEIDTLVSGTLELESKPTWADFDPIATVYPTTDDLALGEWKTYIPTLSGNGTPPTLPSDASVAGYYRRVGDSMEIRVEYSSTTPATGSSAGTSTYYYWTLPSGFTIDATKMVATVTEASVCGTGYIHSSSSRETFSAQALNSTGIGLLSSSAFWDSSYFSITGVNDVGLHATVPIAEWSDLGQVPPIGLEIAQNGAPGLIDYYQAVTLSADGNFTGGEFKIVRVGKVVTITSKSLTHASASGPGSSVGFVPSWARPPGSTFSVILVGTTTQTRMSVNSVGTIAYAHLSTSFTSSNQTSVVDGSITYVVD